MISFTIKYFEKKTKLLPVPTAKEGQEAALLRYLTI